MANPKLNIVITGGSGFIGQALVEALGNDHSITVIDRNPGQNPQAQYLTRPLEEVTLQELANVQVLIHLAWASAPATGFSYAQEFSQNINPSKHLIDTALEAGVRRIVFVSSAGAVYGNVPGPFVETSPTSPVSAYGRAKLAVEDYLRNRAGVTNWIIVRPSNIYGKTQRLKRGQGLIPAVLQAISRQQPFELRGDAQKDYLHINDFVSGLKHLSCDPLVRGIFNISSGQVYATSQIVSMFENVLGTSVAVKSQPLSSYDIDKVEVDSSKLQQRFGWQPEENLEEEIKSMVGDLT